VASLNVYLRDTAQVTTVVLTLWFWLTPIFVSEELYPEQVRFLLAWNPLRYLVRAYRDRILSYRLPTVEEFAVISGYAIASFVIGGLFFRHLKRGFADVL
jgi:lipopolysaccharide transport system permease protein